MNTDIRVAVSFRGHRKRKRLRLLLGPGSDTYLLDLWLATAMNHPSGVLEGMDEVDIALDADWPDEPQTFVDALVRAGFMDKAEDGTYSLHDWADHQSWAVHALERKERAKKAAASRWLKRNAEDMQEALPGASAELSGAGNEHLHGASVEDATGNAPSPIPSPSLDQFSKPVPKPLSPSPAPGRKPPAFAEQSEPYQLALLMRETLKANLPTFKEPNLQAWAKAFDHAIKTDARMNEPGFVAHVIEWACTDSFWRAVIQSPAKLFEKFDQLTAKMEQLSTKAAMPSAAERRVIQNKAACEKAREMLFSNKG